MRRGPILRRRPWKTWRRAESTKVTPELHEYVLQRDRQCLAARVDPDHACRDAWGNPHAPNDLRKLTLDHVKDHPRLGLRAPSTRYHLVAVCHAANVLGWCSANRAIERDWLATMEPDDA